MGTDRIVVVYESMYGNTHAVADAIASGLGSHAEVVVVPAARATADLVAGAVGLVVGGPTHVHGLSTGTSRRAAVADAEKPERDLTLDPDAEGPGLRQWFDELAPAQGTPAAAFDTRLDARPVLTGRASRGIGRRLRHRGYRLAVEPESFLVDRENRLLPGERERAAAWGAALDRTLDSTQPAET